jgi:aminoglycoside 2'-N-acetyltransferase I
MREVRTAHTAELGTATLVAARALLERVFDGDMSEHDWEHSLGGVHVLVWEGSELVGHGAVIQRRLVHAGRALRTGYVEGVGVRADRRGRGHGAAIMNELERIIRAAYELGALGATDEALRFYGGRGWQRWRGPTSALTPGGVVRTEDDDEAVHVLPVTARIDLTGELTCDWREGNVW